VQRGFLLPSLPIVSQYKQRSLGASLGKCPNGPELDAPKTMPKRTDPLTEMQVRKAKPADKPYRLADGKGLYLEVMLNGSRYWRMKYRFDGKEKRAAFGVYPEVGLAAARKRRDEARDLLAAGNLDDALARPPGNGNPLLDQVRPTPLFEQDAD
jgi:hypothetical protein